MEDDDAGAARPRPSPPTPDTADEANVSTADSREEGEAVGDEDEAVCSGEEVVENGLWSSRGEARVLMYWLVSLRKASNLLFHGSGT